MRNVLAALAGGIVIGAVTVWGITHFSAELTEDEDDETAVSAAPSGPPGTVQLSPEQQTKVGIVVATPEPRDLAREVRAFGHVIDPQPLLDLLTELRIAEATLEASTKEYGRVRALHANDQNASARTLETAAATQKRDQIQVEAIRSKLGSTWGATFEKSDVARLVQSLNALEAVLIRVDVPVGDSLASSPVAARVLSPFDQARAADARFLGPAVMASVQSPGQGFLFELEPNSLDLRPEMGVVTYLIVEGPPMHGVVLPRSAIVRHQGQTWIYVQTGDQTFERKPVVLEHAIDAGWFIEASAAPSERIVVTGAQTLLSQELRSQLRLED